MKKMLWLLLAAMPMQAVANEEDPIAYKCYYCTPDEMEDVALAQGVGRHYVYDAQNLSIAGYEVKMADGALHAVSFEAEGWVKNQFLGMMNLYSGSNGEMSIYLHRVELLAPGTEHGKGYSYLWGHHLSSLNPTHLTARQYVFRYLAEHPDLRFLDTSMTSGKLLKFQYMLEGSHPIKAFLWFVNREESYAELHFDHASRQWHYLGTQSALGDSIQESREDFAPTDGHWTYQYHWTDRVLAQAFIERATWANIPVHGQLPVYDPAKFTCKRAGEDIQCHID